MELYHGSNEKFNKFNLDNLGSHGVALGAGIYLTDSLERAKEYGSQVNECLLDTEIGFVSSSNVTIDIDILASLLVECEQYMLNDDGTSIIDDYVEPDSYTVADQELTYIVAENLIDENNNDIDIINELFNMVGGVVASPWVLDFLDKYDIRYSYADFYGDLQYIVFNPSNVYIESKVK